MRLIITSEAQSQALAYGNASPTYEVCGAFLGHKIEDNKWVCDKFIPMRNVSPQTPESRYVPHAQDLMDVLKQTTHMYDDAPKDLIGIFHTHPHSPPIPSMTDTHGASYEGFYIIHSPFTRTHATYYYNGIDPVFEHAELHQF